jgi:hypothetical protein
LIGAPVVRSARRLAAAVLCLAISPMGVAFAAEPPADVGASGAPTLVGIWSRQERELIASALRRLPPGIVARAPKRIIRDRALCEPDGLPPDDVLLDARGDAHLCVSRPEGGALDAGREVALALLFGFDHALRWSEDPSWRRLNGWQLSLIHPLQPRPDNLHPAGFVAPRGGRSPRWDLVAFAAALLLEEPGGDGVACRLLAQAAFVDGRLERLHAGGAVGAAHARCAAFERWAALDRITDVEIVLATPSTASAASLFGHVFLRIAYRDDDGSSPLHRSNTIAFLADNDVPFAADRGYALKGITGFYTASLHQRPFLDAYREYVVLEGRDLRRWRLNLTAAERRDLMLRLWTAERAARTSYYFFRRNCATLMLDIVDQARGSADALRSPGLLAAPPASLLEPWARARGADGAPLLQFVPEPLWSFDHRARRTSRHRRELEERLTGTLGAGKGAALRAVFEETHRPAPAARAAAYERLAAALAAPRSGADDDVRAWLSDSATIESHLSTLANLEAEARADQERHRRVGAAVADLIGRLQADAAALRASGTGAVAAGALEQAVRSVAGDDADDRLAGYQTLLAVVRGLPSDPGAGAIADRVRLLALLQSEARYDVARMKRVPGLRDALLFPDAARAIDEQPYVAGHADLVRVPIETRVSDPLRSLQRTRQALFAGRGLDTSETFEERRAADAAAVVRAERAAYEGSLSRSGIDQTAVLAGVVADRALPGGSAAVLTVAGALYDERIGDHRRFGFPSDTALVVGRSALSASWRDGRPVVQAFDSRLFGYRSLRQALPETGRARGPFGWELYLDLAGNPGRNLTAQTKVGWGVLAPVLDRHELGDHLLFGVGLAYHAYFPGGAAGSPGRQHGLALPAFLETRLGVGAMPRHRSWIGARLWAEPLAIGGGVPDRALVDAGVSLEAHLALRARADSGAHDPAVLLRLQAQRSALSFDGHPGRTEVMLAAGVELR